MVKSQNIGVLQQRACMRLVGESGFSRRSSRRSPPRTQMYSILSIEHVVCAAILGQDRFGDRHRLIPTTCLLATRAITNPAQDWCPERSGSSTLPQLQCAETRSFIIWHRLRFTFEPRCGRYCTIARQSWDVCLRVRAGPDLRAPPVGSIFFSLLGDRPDLLTGLQKPPFCSMWTQSTFGPTIGPFRLCCELGARSEPSKHRPNRAAGHLIQATWVRLYPNSVKGIP